MSLHLCTNLWQLCIHLCKWTGHLLHTLRSSKPRVLSSNVIRHISISVVNRINHPFHLTYQLMKETVTRHSHQTQQPVHLPLLRHLTGLIQTQPVARESSFLTLHRLRHLHHPVQPYYPYSTKSPTSPVPCPTLVNY